MVGNGAQLSDEDYTQVIDYVALILDRSQKRRGVVTRPPQPLEPTEFKIETLM